MLKDGDNSGAGGRGFDDPAIESATLAELIVRSATDFAIITSNPIGTINSWNPGAEKVLGWSSEEAIGRSIGLFFTPEDRDAGRPDEEMKCAREYGSAADERWHMRKDGSRFWANGELQPLRQNGELVGFVKILRDRTEQQQLQQRLAEAKDEAALANARLQGEGERLRTLFEAAPGFIAVLRGPAHVFDLTNASYMQLVGHRDVLGKPVREALPEVEGQGFFELLDSVYATGERVTLNQVPIMLQRTPDAEPEQRFISLVYEPMRDAEGNVTGIFAEGFDTTEATTARAEAEKVAAEQAAMLSQLSEGVIATDAAGRISFVNDAAERLHGGAKLDVPPDAYSEAYQLLTEGGESYPPQELPLARAVLRGETVQDARWRIRRPDGSEVLAIGNAKPVVADGKQIGAVLTVRDDTARRSAESALDESRSYLRLLLDSTQEAFYSVDADGVTTLCNAAFVRLLGFGRQEDAVGRKLHDVIHHSHPDGSRYAKEDCPVYQCAKFGTPAVVEDELFYKLDGTPFPVEYRVSPILRDGELRGAICIFVDVTERKASEQALREGEAHFRELADNIPTLCWTARADGHIFWYNKRWYEYTGTSPDTQEGWGWESVHDPDCLPLVVENWTRAIETGSLFAMTFPLKGADGRFRRFLTRVVPIRDEGGQVVRWFGTNTDIEEQKVAELALRESEERFRLIADSSPVVMWVTAPDRTREFVNRAYVEFLDMSYEDAVRFDWRQILHPDDQARIVAESTAGEASGAPFTLEARYLRKDGEYRWLRSTSQPRALATGTQGGFIGVAHDVTDAKRAAEALHELNRTLETRVNEAIAERDTIWRTSQDLFVVCGFDGLYKSVNPAWGAALDLSSDELVGARFDQNTHPDDVGAAESAFAAITRGEVVNGVDIRMRHKNGGYRWFSWTCVPQDEVFYAAGRDVTARKELEEQLRQSQKMEAVGQLTGGIAHDFNNLLTIVSGNIDMARRSLGEDGDARALRSLGNAAKGADRAAALTQRLLAFSRRQPLQPRATDVNKLIAGMTELLDRALGETVQLQVVAGAGLWRVEVDPNQLENAVLNLAVNARDAMPGGGKLTIETTNSAIDEAYAAAQAEVAPGQYVLISVTDTGEGMPPDVVAKAFDPFFSTKDVGKGTGLGLSQVYGYVKQSGGHVKIYSEAGHGTTIKVYLPRLVADISAAEEVEQTAEPALKGMESILVVEDDDDVRIFTVDSLRELGYRVLEAHDGASALRLLQRQEEPPRLLLTDVVMPGMSGRELAEEVRAAYPDMRVLYTTGYARNAIDHGGRLDPGVELLPKPFTYDALAAKVREVLEKSGVERALILDACDTARAASADALATLGFDAEPAANLREALGKLRVAGGRFDVVMLSGALPVAKLVAAVEEMHAVRSDLPILIVSEGGAEDLEERYASAPCVAMIAAADLATGLRDHLVRLRVDCAHAD